ncbi:glycosyl transferase [Halostagnicola larsenii XH-48]|uniref:Glycosyl transferase n=1 Tax=Halostagnicola larsenii XH-48 TaxID=797299 RepID=W0JR35_9EURY|nr:glycosyltransferase family 4 protein [Halostagnicola larsenii]AHF99741.1 glycosyl transferase [Halostagnicola larsenii XH-48]
MKVLQLVTSPRPFFEQQVSVLEDRDIECTVLGVPGEYEGDAGRTPLDYVRYYPKILSRIRATDFDLVHANYGLTAPFALAQPTRPVVLTLWGTDLMSEQDWLRSLSRFGARRSNAVIVPSQALAQRLETSHELIPFGVDTDLFRPISQIRARQRVGWRADRPIALFPYDEDRSVKDVSRARALVDRTDTDLELRTVHGVDHDEIPYYMNASDVLLVTSKRESGPMVVKEAAACNLPVVSTDVGFVSETVGDVSHCVVSDRDDDLIAGLETIAEERPRSDGRETIDGLSLESMGDALASLYGRVLAANGSVRATRGVAREV